MPRIISFDTILDPGQQGSQEVAGEDRRRITFRAVFDTANGQKIGTLYDCYADLRCPRFYDYWNIDGRLDRSVFVVNREGVQRTDAPQAFDITITYSNKWTLNFDGKFSWIEDPLARPALYNWGHYVAREAVEIAKGDKDTDKQFPVATTAGEPLILEEEFRRRKIVVTKNVSSIDGDLFAKGGDYINSDTVTLRNVSFPKYTLWLWPIDVGPMQFENGVYFYEIVMTLLYNPNTWIRRVRNAGYYYRDPNTTKVTDDKGNQKTVHKILPIRFEGGVKADRPVLLDKEGLPLNAVTSGKDPDIKVTIKSPEAFGRAYTQAELDSSVLYFRTREKLSFMQSLPLY